MELGKEIFNIIVIVGLGLCELWWISVSLEDVFLGLIIGEVFINFMVEIFISFVIDEEKFEENIDLRKNKNKLFDFW